MSESLPVTETARNAFKSGTLVYRAIEDNDEDFSFFRDSIARDPQIQASWSNSLVQPQSAAMLRDTFRDIRVTTLAVYICLPSVAKSSGETSQGVEAQVPIGIVSLRTQSAGKSQHRASLLSIAVSAPYQGKGYGAEAISWALDWAFRFGNLHRVGLDVFSFNHRAIRLYERLGFVKEGVTREVIWFDRKWHDLVCYAMLESEWEQLRQK
jgi:RimJ/RimL family protein N-acetyltransferase